ncbi:MAG TPA: four helix bundle protein [bacterium]|nr:four helix bundle protein [bacterium]
MKSDLEKASMAYDLEERTSVFGENIINFCKSLEHNFLSKIILAQLLRSATSVGANYIEANNASSKKDFRNKIYICKKEANETRYWLKMIRKYNSSKELEIQSLLKEAHEFSLIFGKISASLNKNLELKIK